MAPPTCMALVRSPLARQWVPLRCWQTSGARAVRPATDGSNAWTLARRVATPRRTATPSSDHCHALTPAAAFHGTLQGATSADGGAQNSRATRTSASCGAQPPAHAAGPAHTTAPLATGGPACLAKLTDSTAAVPRIRCECCQLHHWVHNRACGTREL